MIFRLGMKFTWALITGCLFLCTEGTTLREKRSTDCAGVFTECVKSETGKYETEVGKGDDGWMDWRARKTCNYITDAVKGCGDALVEQGCVNAVVMKLKDTQMSAILKKMETDEDWDESLCPVVKEYVSRNPSAKAGNDSSSGSRMTASVMALAIGYMML